MKKALLLLLLSLIIRGISYGQEKTITGTVTETDGNPLTGVTIVIKGTTNGVVTDLNGNFSLTVPNENAVLTFSYIGKLTEEIVVGSQTTIALSMVDDMVGLEDIVVVGYGTVKRSDLTGAVATLKAEDLNDGVSPNVDQMLTGRVAGVQVNQNSSEPGGGISINIRGVNSINAGNQPLYVIDGLIMDNTAVITGDGNGFTAAKVNRNPLNSLNPNDIESIEVLKDASASAIYGSRGANGVIIITTKKGKGGKSTVSYDMSYGVQKIASKLPVLSATQYQTVLNELYDAGSIMASPGERVDTIQGVGTDWQDEVFRNAMVQSHNLSISGGNDKTNYFSAFGYYNQDGVVISSGMKRYTARLNIDHKASDKFKTGVNISTTSVVDDFVANGVTPNEGAGVISCALDFDPTLNIYDTDGNYQESDYITKENPLAVAHGKTSEQVTFRTFGNAYAEYSIIEGLSIKFNGGGDVANSRKDVFINSLSETGRQASVDGVGSGIATIINATRYNVLAEGTINYNKTFGIHSFNAVVGATMQNFTSVSQTAISKAFVIESTKTNRIQDGNQSTFDLSSGKTERKLQSYLGRLNYVLKDKYLATVSFRYDGSSVFGENNRFSFFPSAALGWKLDKEPFIQDLGIFNQLKLRASIGESGFQAIAPYQTEATLKTNADAVYFEDDPYVAFLPSRAANPNLQWESTTQYDIAVDFGILNSRVSGTIDYFYKHTKNLLMEVTVPLSTGYSSMWDNVGEVVNKGLEFGLTTHNISTRNLSWVSNINCTYLKNEIRNLGGLDEIIRPEELQFTKAFAINRVGETMDSYYGYEVLGVWQEGDDLASSKDGVRPGDFKYKDQNGDSLITSEDKVLLGKTIPDFTWGFVNEITYKGIKLSFALQGVHGVELLNNQLRDTYYPINFRRNKIAEPYVNRWTTENPTNEYPSFINPYSQGTPAVNTKTVEDASYVRIQYVTLGYDFPVEKVKFLNNLYVYGTITNLYTWTKYSGFDPASNNFGNVGAVRVDYNAYPLARTYSFGLKVTF